MQTIQPGSHGGEYVNGTNVSEEHTASIIRSVPHVETKKTTTGIQPDMLQCSHKRRK
jgi:hypothetical protein